MKKLVICEKFNAAQRIASILSGGKFEKSSYERVPIFSFKRNNDEYYVIGLKGHIVSLDYEKKYNQWLRVKPKELVQAKPIKKIDSKSMANALKKFGKDADEIIVATDYDREGELIGLEAVAIILGSLNEDDNLNIENIDKNMGKDIGKAEKTKKTKKEKKNPEIRRARFSALTKEEVTKAFKELTSVDKNLALSAEARQVIDLAWGAVLTRFISLASQQTGKDFLSVGRVQSPTLALIVNRELEIQSFKPTPYWEVHAELEKDIKFPARHATEKFLKIEDAKKAHENAKKADKGIVTDSKISMKHEKPPSPFNTTMFLAAAGSIGLSPAQAMNIAEELYTNGYISYPRTDNTVYPPSEDLKGILNKLLSTEFANDVKEILSKGELHPTAGKKSTTDHPPIHPTDAADRKKLSEAEWKVYELIVRRFLATLGEDMVSEVISLKFDLNGEPFVSRGLRIVDKGWRKYYPYGYIKETELPKLKVNDIAKVLSVELVSKMTQPPKRYSQGGLIQEMERLGLGTKSTRHEIIQKLYARNYIQGVPPQPTKPGIAVTQALEKHAEKITKPDMTSMLEKEMDKIAEGEKDFESTIDESKEMLKQIVEIMDANRTAIGKAIKDALKSQNVIGKCPDCNGNLGILRSQKGKRFVGCSNFPKCKRSYPLPQNGKVVYSGETCSECGSPKVKLITKGKRPWLMCLNLTCPSKAKGRMNANEPLNQNNKVDEKSIEETDPSQIVDE